MTKEVKELFTRDDDLLYAKGAKKPFTGSHKLYHDNGQIRMDATFKNGEKDGVEKQWHDNGEKFLEVSYKHNKAAGLCTYYHDNGNKQVEGMYKNGNQEGVWSYYDENGKKLSKSDVFKDGELVERDGVKVSYFSNLVNGYEETYHSRLQEWYENYQTGETSYEDVAKMCNYPTNTIIVDTGDVSYLVLRPNNKPVKLDPFYDVCEDSMDSSYAGPIISTISPVGGFNLVRYLPGVDAFDYPSIDKSSSFNDGYGPAYKSYEIFFEKSQKIFKDLNLDGEKNYILGRKLIISVLILSNVITALMNEDLDDDNGKKMSLEDKLSDSSVVKLFSTIVSEKIQEIYEWAASEDEGYEDDGLEDEDQLVEVKNNTNMLISESVEKWRENKVKDSVAESSDNAVNNIPIEDNSNSKELELSPLWMSFMTGDIDHFIELVKEGEDVNEMADPARMNFSFGLLHLAAEQGEVEIIQLLLDSGADIEAKLTSGETPLSYALKGENMENFHLLLKSGANPDPKLIADSSYDRSKHGPGFSPLRMAARHDLDNAVAELIELGVDVNKVDHFGAPALKHAISINCIRALLSAGANPNLTDDEGFAPIHRAINEDDHEIVSMLIDAGADVNLVIEPKQGTDAKDQGWSLLMTACFNPIKNELIELLVKNGADVSLHGKDENNESTTPPIWLLIESSMFYGDDPTQAVDLLINNGVDVKTDAPHHVALGMLGMSADNVDEVPIEAVELILNKLKKDVQKFFIVDGKKIPIEKLLGDITNENRRKSLIEIFDKYEK